jgi:hypothetical protein
MSGLSGKLAQAKYAFKDLNFCADGRLNARRDELMQELALARQKAKRNEDNPDPRLVDNQVRPLEEEMKRVEQKMRDSLYTIRITATNRGEWNKLKMQHPPRKNNPVDQNLGFNTETLFVAGVQKFGKFVTEPGTEEKDWADAVLEDVTEEEWKAAGETWTAGDWDRVDITILNLNAKASENDAAFLQKG